MSRYSEWGIRLSRIVKIVVLWVTPAVMMVMMALCGLAIYAALYLAVAIALAAVMTYVERVVLTGKPYRHVVSAAVGWFALMVALLALVTKSVEIPVVKPLMDVYASTALFWMSISGIIVMVSITYLPGRINIESTKVDFGIRDIDELLRKLGKIPLEQTCVAEHDNSSKADASAAISLIVLFIISGIFYTIDLRNIAAAIGGALLIWLAAIIIIPADRMMRMFHTGLGYYNYEYLYCYDREEEWTPFVNMAAVFGLGAIAVLLFTAVYTTSLGMELTSNAAAAMLFITILSVLFWYHLKRYPAWMP